MVLSYQFQRANEGRVRGRKPELQNPQKLKDRDGAEQSSAGIELFPRSWFDSKVKVQL